MSEHSKTYLRGLLIPDTTITGYLSTESTSTQASPRAGVPTPQVDTEAVLQATGNQTDDDDGQQIEVLTHRGGYAGPDKAGFVWRHTASPAESYRGWDVPQCLSSWKNVDYNNTAGNNLGLHLANITKEDGTDYMLSVETSISGANAKINYRKYTEAAGWGSATQIFSQTKYANDDATQLYNYSCLVVLPSGRVQVFSLYYDSTEDTVTVRMYYTDDEGSTWTLGSSACIDGVDVSADNDGIPVRLRVAYKDGQHLMLLHLSAGSKTYPDIIRQYASDDMGATFTSVRVWTGAAVTEAGGWPDITVADGKFVVAWISKNAAKAAVQLIGTAYDQVDPSTVEMSACVDVIANNGAAAMSEGELSLASDEDGIIYLYVMYTPASAPQGGVIRSLDGGNSWESPGYYQQFAGGSSWWAPGGGYGSSTDIRITNYATACRRGQVVMVHSYVDAESSTALGEHSFCMMTIGGYSSVTLPSLFIFDRASKRVSFQSHYIGCALPAEFNSWTKTTTGGTEAINTTEGALRINTRPTASNTLFYTETFSEGTGNQQVAFTEGLLGQYTSQMIFTGTRFRVQPLVWGTASGYVGISIDIDTTGIHVKTIANVVLGEVLFAPLSKKIQVLWGIKGGESAGTAGVWYREIASEDNIDREWTLVYQGAVAIVAGGTTSFIKWGDMLTATTTDSYIYDFCYSYGANNAVTPRVPMVGRQLSGGQVNPTELFRRNYSTSPVFITKNTRVAMTDGPTFEQDQWLINIRWLYGYDNMLPAISPSPLQGWRSTTKVADQYVAWQRNPDSTDAYTGSDLYAVHLEQVNFKSCTVEYKTGAAWTAVGTFNLSQTFSFTRKGNTLRAIAGGSTASTWIGADELAGCTFEDAVGVTCKISHNSAGYFYNNEGGKMATIYLDATTYTQAALGTSGTGSVWFKKGSFLFELADMDFEAIRLKLSPTGITLPYEAYHTIGSAIFGSVTVFGMDYSRARILTKESPTELVTYRNGARHSYTPGAARQLVRFSWAEGVDTTQARQLYAAGGSPEPTTVNYIQGGSTPTANRYDAPLLMYSLVDQLDGAGTCLVYLPYIKTVSAVGSAVNIINNARGAIYGRLSSPVSIEADVGSEEVDTVYRVNTITIEQEL